MTHKEMIDVIRAAELGHPIQSRPKDRPAQDWGNIAEPSWDFYHWDYRVKPEPPKPREWWLLIDNGGRATHIALSQREAVDRSYSGSPKYTVIKVQEVLE